MTILDDDVTSAGFGGSVAAGGMTSPWGSGDLDRVRGVERLVEAR